MRYQNTQLWCECQFVSLWNACRYWGKEDVVPEIGSVKYRVICDIGCCINGSCIVVSSEFKRVGIKRIKGRRSLKWVKANLPVEAGVQCHRGYHSVLIVDVKDNKVLVTNYTWGRTQWLNWKTLKMKMRKDPCSFQIQE